MCFEKEEDVCRVLRDSLRRLVERGEASFIMKIFPEGKSKSLNLSTKRFRDLWREWSSDEHVPQLDIDILLALNERVQYTKKPSEEKVDLGKPCLLGVEVKFFKEKTRRGFYEGLGQALAYLSIGVDKAALLHVFHPEYPDDQIRPHVNAVYRLVYGLDLPIAYVACKIISSDRFKVFHELIEYEATCKDLFLNLGNAPVNPLYSKTSYGEKVVNLRHALMACLKIPIFR